MAWLPRLLTDQQLEQSWRQFEELPGGGIGWFLFITLLDCFAKEQETGTFVQFCPPSQSVSEQRTMRIDSLMMKTQDSLNESCKKDIL
eukprot:g3431.t1